MRATVEDMTPPVIARWVDIIENDRTSELDGLLADDAVFYSPAVFTPQEGRAKTVDVPDRGGEGVRR